MFVHCSTLLFQIIDATAMQPRPVPTQSNEATADATRCLATSFILFSLNRISLGGIHPLPDADTSSSGCRCGRRDRRPERNHPEPRRLAPHKQPPPQASLAAAKQQTEILKSNYEQATANVAGLTSQVAFNAKRLADIQKLVAEDANTQFQEQDRQNQYETSLAQLNVAKAAQQGAKLALDSEIGGVNTTVAQMQAQLESAVWELAQTTIRAPADGYATVVALTIGDRAFQLRSAMSFIVENEITIVGMFSQNGFQTIRAGTPVNIVFDNAPGRIYHARITEIPKGIGQGQIAVSGTLARTNAIGGASAFPAVISVPDEMSRDSLRLGMSGSATAFAENAGVIGLLASILVWVSAL
jgi:multidrug resistance efflux pump